MPSNTACPARKSLADQIDRLDSILDGLADAIPEVVADAVRASVAEALASAARAAVGEALSSPEVVARLRDAVATAGPARDAAAPLPSPVRPDAWAAPRAACGPALALASRLASAFGRKASSVVAAARRRSREAVIGLGAGALSALSAHLLGPAAATLLCALAAAALASFVVRRGGTASA